MTKPYQPVIIIGAPRSGTNMLRDVLLEIDGVCSWPCDEINYIWRHGNVRYPSDEIPAERATESVRRYIRAQFDKAAKNFGGDVVLEKTCANALRCDFVDAVVPDAKYIVICRDGFDAVASARHRWTAELDIPYLLKKLRYVPVSDLPYYGSRYLFNRLYLLFSRQKRLAYWGPALDDMNTLSANYSLTEICALQWQRCVQKSLGYLDGLPKGRVSKVRYEDFVSDPATHVQELAAFMGKSLTPEQAATITRRVSGRSVGKARAELSPEDLGKCRALISETLTRLGYKNA
ncbi:sulfotransferase [Granulosicoccaceae sp. 1_MG-2023]|nr:sulfotransferase [Granulosicoccaceae sp. 1_MG-2023]